MAALSISLPKARELFKRDSLDLDALKKEIGTKRKTVTAAVQADPLAIPWKLRKVTPATANVIRVLEGSDPVMKNEAVVIGAHYDHIGLGDLGSLAQSPGRQIHNGADASRRRHTSA